MQTKVDNDSAKSIDGKAVKAGNGPLLVSLDNRSEVSSTSATTSYSRPNI